MVDFFSHALWAYALFHRDPSALAYAGFSLLPDILWGIPAIVAFTIGGNGFQQMRSIRWRGPHENAAKTGLPAFIRIAYHASHSWLLMAIASVAVALLLPAFFLPFFAGVFLHLAMDLLVHKDSIAGQKPLYPVSNYKVKGFIHWSNKKFLAANYSLLAVIYALIYLGYL